MNLSICRTIENVKRLRADRAERAVIEARERQAAAARADEAARQALAAWTQELPARIDAIYQPTMGCVLERGMLKRLQDAELALLRHREALRHKVDEAAKNLLAADEAANVASAAMIAAYRAHQKMSEVADKEARREREAQEQQEEAERDDLPPRAGGGRHALHGPA